MTLLANIINDIHKNSDSNKFNDYVESLLLYIKRYKIDRLQDIWQLMRDRHLFLHEHKSLKLEIMIYCLQYQDVNELLRNLFFQILAHENEQSISYRLYIYVY